MELLASRYRRFIIGKRAVDTHCIGEWVGSGWDLAIFIRERNFTPARNQNMITRVSNPQPCHYND